MVTNNNYYRTTTTSDPNVTKRNTLMPLEPLIYNEYILSKEYIMYEKQKVTTSGPTSTGGGKKKYPFSDLEVGEGFFAPDKTIQQVSSALCNWKNVLRKYRDREFQCWTEKDEQGNKKGVWVRRNK